jgi:arginine/serine-rich splicing factor 7
MSSERTDKKMSRYRGESTECKVYVGDLPRDAEERDLERSFGHYGSLKSVWIARNPPGFAFIEFEDARDAEDAVRGLDGNNICGVRVRVEHATGKTRPKPWSGGGGGGGRGGGGRGPPRSGFGGRGGGGDSRRGNFDPNDRCFVCNERGHYSYDCPKSGGGRGGSSRKRQIMYS